MIAILRALLCVLYPLAIGVCAATCGILIGIGVCEAAMQARLIVPDANIDDDAMMIVMLWACGGGLLGFLLGTGFGVRVIADAFRPAGATLT